MKRSLILSSLLVSALVGMPAQAFLGPVEIFLGGSLFGSLLTSGTVPRQEMSTILQNYLIYGHEAFTYVMNTLESTSNQNHINEKKFFTKQLCVLLSNYGINKTFEALELAAPNEIARISLTVAKRGLAQLTFDSISKKMQWDKKKLCLDY